MLTKKIFLASSAELKGDRDQFEIFINRKNKEWVARGVFLELVVWEDFLDAVSQTRLQDEYNKAVRECDLFVMLFCTKVGRYTEEEFETAFKQFKATSKPFIFTYFKKTQVATDAANRKDLMSLLAFQEKLDALGHFQTVYENTEGLLLHFTGQLDKLVDSGFIEFKPDDDEPAAPGGTNYNATLTGNGAIAQGKGAVAVGSGGVHVRGKNTGSINTGTQTNIDTGSGNVGGDINVQGDFVGRNRINTGTQTTIDSSSRSWAKQLATARDALPESGHQGRKSFSIPADASVDESDQLFDGSRSERLSRPFPSIAAVDDSAHDREASAPTSTSPALEFVLVGQQAKGLTLLAAGTAQLVFRQILASLASGAIVEGEGLAALYTGIQRLDISLAPDDGLTIDGPHSVAAQFEDGMLREPVSFALRDSVRPTGVHIEFHHAGVRLYEFRLPITVLPQGAPLPDAAMAMRIDLDAVGILRATAEVAKTSRRIRLKACIESSQLYLSLDDYIDGELSDSIEGFAASIDRARLDTLRGQVTAALGAGFYDSDAWTHFDGSNTTTPAYSRLLAAATVRMAQAGGLLFRALHEDPQFKSILDYIAGTETGTRITIMTRDVMLPWELLYTERFDPDDPERWPLDPTLFWGVRFALETLILGEGDYFSLIKARRQATAEISLNLNPTISIHGKRPREVYEVLADALRSHVPQVKINDECKTIRSTLLKAETNATLIYLFCHGSPPPTAGAPQLETLSLANDCDVNVDQIDADRCFRNAPIIFLNACRAGSFSPLSFTGFLRAFRRKKALGLIAPSFDVPISYAARLGEELVAACFQRKGISLAELLRKYREENMRWGNPIPLFYTVQCQVDL